MARQSYLVNDPASYEALLTTSHTCIPNSSCPYCTTSVTKTITGEDPDSGSGITWSSEDVAGNNSANTRSDKLHRWPYQIITQSQALGCNANCVYLMRIQYKLQTSSARRSFFQCGFSDIWIVERWNNAGEMQELHYVANSVPFDFDNSELISAYTAGEINSKKLSTSSADQRTYFNPYGLRERYDPNVDDLETHCGTLLFFARGNDTIKFRLAQHTRLNNNIDINPSAATIRTSFSIQSPRYDYGGGKYDVQGQFALKAYTRPIPGKLKLSDKTHDTSANPVSEYNLKYHPKLFS
jgi:hypothetical protein